MSTTRSTPQTHFKGWAIPGPQVPGGLVPEDGETLDALSGHFRIFQYKDGHRFSTDDVITAWYGTTHAPAARRVLDLGSGIGSVGMIAAWRLQGARFTTIEAQAISVRLARKSARYNGLEGRYEIREGDFRDAAALGLATQPPGPADSATAAYDLVLGSPPYFPLGTGVTAEHEQKIACRFEVRGDVADYCAAAARALAPGGTFACVFPHAQRERAVQGAHESGLTLTRSRPVVLREGEPPLLWLFAATRSADLPERYRAGAGYPWPWEEPPLVIRARDGSVHPEYAAVKTSVGFPP